MRFHLPGLPHTLTTPAYVHCAYTEKVRKFAQMMRDRGHSVFLYESDDPLPPDQNLTFPFEVHDPRWVRQNERAIAAIREHLDPADILCLIGGLCQQPIAQAFPSLIAVEFGIGYYGTFAPFQVFESYAHQATCYGKYGVTRGKFFDAVIPNYYDLADFPVVIEKDDYLLFVGRLNEDKGIGIASDVAQRTGRRLVVCGQGVPPTGAHIDYRGLVQAEERAALMGKARALLAPTLYLEPFGGVVVEAQLCGTPVITTDWGAFPETVEQGVTGYRCHVLQEFLEAVEAVETLSPVTIAIRAQLKYDMRQVAQLYDRYFSRLLTLWGQGWYQLAA